MLLGIPSDAACVRHWVLLAVFAKKELEIVELHVVNGRVVVAGMGR